MTDGPQREQATVRFSIPSVCAEELEAGIIDTGILPVAEISRQRLKIISAVGIAAVRPVRSILLFAKVPWSQVRSLAADTASRTSVQLARVILREQYGATPTIVRAEPDLEAMLAQADAALIIGDPALRIEPQLQSYAWLDLAEVWIDMTGLPFVFAAWAARSPDAAMTTALRKITEDSYSFGREHLSAIVQSEYPRRGISAELTDRYLRHHLHYELGTKEQEGLAHFLSLAGLPAILT